MFFFETSDIHSQMFQRVFRVIVNCFALAGFVLIAGFFAVKYGFTNTRGVVDEQRESFLNAAQEIKREQQSTSTKDSEYYWEQSSEWNTLRTATQKDKSAIERAASTAGVPARLIVAQLITEQLRLFFTEREFYKQFFEPLKILGSQTQFSWGVMGIKEETATQIEENLKNKTSPYYLGEEYEHLLDFKTEDIKQERFERMTDSHNHYYSYLYAGLYLKEIETQWKNAGFDVSNRPDVLATLYNIGFNGSKPNANPKSGGAEIKISDRLYSFGSLSAEFYNSSELLDEFPRD